MKKWENALSRRKDNQSKLDLASLDCSLFFSVTFFGSVWYFLFQLNNWLFSAQIKSPYVSLIFLPQIIRLIAILLCGWRGALGLFVGALLTGNYTTLSHAEHSIILSLFSALGAYLAVYAFRWLKNIPENLAGLKGSHLWQLSFLGALFNSLPTNGYLLFTGLITNWQESVLSMFVGDSLGSLMMLYFFRFTQKLYLRVSGD